MYLNYIRSNLIRQSVFFHPALANQLSGCCIPKEVSFNMMGGIDELFKEIDQFTYEYQTHKVSIHARRSEETLI